MKTRMWKGWGNIWVESDGDIPSCDFCEKTIDEADLFDAGVGDTQVCTSDKCRLLAIEYMVEEITEEVEGEEGEEF